jgi:uncharacterized repeat protein (TIGR01451 family)
MRITTTTGATSRVGSLGLTAVDGLGSDFQGNLWATTGTGGPASTDSSLWAVDKATGAASNQRSLTTAYGTEYEGVDCVSQTLAPAAPLLTIVKSASTAAASPGDLIVYSVTVVNTGVGPATAVRLRDHLSPYTAFGFHGYGSDLHFTCTAGCTASTSGLTLGTPVFDDGSAAFVYPGPPGPSQQFDGAVTDWLLPMTGTMNPGGAQFTIQYRVRVK